MLWARKCVSISNSLKIKRRMHAEHWIYAKKIILLITRWNQAKFAPLKTEKNESFIYLKILDIDKTTPFPDCNWILLSEEQNTDFVWFDFFFVQFELFFIWFKISYWPNGLQVTSIVRISVVWPISCFFFCKQKKWRIHSFIEFNKSIY